MIYCASYVRLRYNINDVFARYAFFIDLPAKASYENLQVSVRNDFGSCETVTPYLRSLGIERTDRVISVGDFSPNISLYLMDQKGFNNYCLWDSIDKLTPRKIRELNIKYLILLRRSWLEKDYLKPFFKYKIGEYHNITIFDLRPYLKENTIHF